MTFPQRMKGAPLLRGAFFIYSVQFYHCTLIVCYPNMVITHNKENFFGKKLLILHKNMLYCFQNDPVGLFHRRSAIHARACAESKGNASTRFLHLGGSGNRTRRPGHTGTLRKERTLP